MQCADPMSQTAAKVPSDGPSPGRTPGRGDWRSTAMRPRRLSVVVSGLLVLSVLGWLVLAGQARPLTAGQISGPEPQRARISLKTPRAIPLHEQGRVPSSVSPASFSAPQQSALRNSGNDSTTSPPAPPTPPLAVAETGGTPGGHSDAAVIARQVFPGILVSPLPKAVSNPLSVASAQPPVPDIPNIPQATDGALPDAIEVAPPADPVPLQNSGSSMLTAPMPGQSDLPSSLLMPGTVETGPAVVRTVPEARPRFMGGHSAFGAAPGTSGFRATVESDSPAWLNPYMGRTELMPATGETQITPSPSFAMPPDFRPWWDSLVTSRMGIAPVTLPVEVGTLVQRAMLTSPQILALQAEPEVAQRVVWQEEAAFDWRTFLETTYDGLNDPVGNTLTTGNNDTRFRDNRFNGGGGVRRRTDTGGELELAQRIGHQYNNSRFLVPNPQSTSRLELSFRQPLLSRAGTIYNQKDIVLARIATNTSSDEVLGELQNHLFQVTEAYWNLYRARAEYVQRQKLLASSQDVLRTLSGRNEVDTIPRQILRARAAVARAEARMQRAVTSIRNAESQLRLLVNDPEMLNQGPIEFLPVETPVAILPATSLRDSLQTALINRPDVSKAIRQMRASSVRLGVSRNELLPKLDFLVTTYVAGLEAQNEIPKSIGNQFADGGPGYTVGLEFEVPLGNRAARARVEQRQWELQRSINVFRATVEASLTDVEVSSREVETAFREMQARFEVMTSAQNETSYLKDRFDVLPMAEDSAILLLEDLLDGFERLADEEAAFVDSQVVYALSLIQLRRSTGVLLRSRHEVPNTAAEETEWMSHRISETSGSPADEQRSTPAGNSPLPASAGAAGAPVNTVSHGAGGRPRPPVAQNTGTTGGHSLTMPRVAR